MRHSFIINEKEYAANSGTAASRIDLAYNLKKGSIAFYNSNGVLLDKTASNIAGSEVIIAMGLGDNRVKTLIIDRDTFKYVQTAASGGTNYKAAANKVAIVGGDGSTYKLNLPTTIIAGDVATVSIYNTSRLSKGVDSIIHYTVPMVGGETALQVITKVAAAINGNAKSIVSAAAYNTNTGITITGTKGYNFKVRVSGILESADVLEHNLVNGEVVSYTSGVTAYEKGRGTYAQAVEAEMEDEVLRGKTNYPTEGNLFYTGESLAVSTNTYNVFEASYKMNTESVKHSMDAIVDLVIYVNSDTGSTSDPTTTAVNDILDAI